MRPAPAGLSRQEWGLPAPRGGPVPHVTIPIPTGLGSLPGLPVPAWRRTEPSTPRRWSRSCGRRWRPTRGGRGRTRPSCGLCASASPPTRSSGPAGDGRDGVGTGCSGASLPQMGFGNTVTKALLGAGRSCHGAHPTSRVGFGALSFGAPILGLLKRRGHPGGFELPPCSARGLIWLSVLSAPGGHERSLAGQQTHLRGSQKGHGSAAQNPGGAETTLFKICLQKVIRLMCVG